jgi:hypothetical protein
MLGITVNAVALLVAQENFTNSPAAAMPGETEKLVTAGAVEPPPPPLPPLPLPPPELEL